MSTGGNKRSRAVCIRAYLLSKAGFSHREIATLILCDPKQVAGKVKRGEQAFVRDERQGEEA